MTGLGKSRSVVALTLVSGGQPQRDVFRIGLTSSLPQLAWGVRVADPVIRGAHAAAWDLLTQGPHVRWLNQVLLETDIARDDCTGSTAAYFKEFKRARSEGANLHGASLPPLRQRVVSGLAGADEIDLSGEVAEVAFGGGGGYVEVGRKMSHDDYSQRQKTRDAEYERQYKAWIKSLPPNERRKLEARDWPNPIWPATATGPTPRNSARKREDRIFSDLLVKTEWLGMLRARRRTFR